MGFPDFLSRREQLAYFNLGQVDPRPVDPGLEGVGIPEFVLPPVGIGGTAGPGDVLDGVEAGIDPARESLAHQVSRLVEPLAHGSDVVLRLLGQLAEAALGRAQDLFSQSFWRRLFFEELLGRLAAQALHVVDHGH